MKKKTIRTGIIGAGFAATFHFECLKKVHGTDVEVEGVFAIDKDQAQSYAEKRGIRAYKSLEKLLDKVDVIHVCTPPVAHEPIAIAALERDTTLLGVWVHHIVDQHAAHVSTLTQQSLVKTGFGLLP